MTTPLPSDGVALAEQKDDWKRILVDHDMPPEIANKAIELAELNGLFDAVKHCLASNPARSGDYVMVPREPTEEMLRVETNPILRLGDVELPRVQQWRYALYKAMIAASPQGPSEAEIIERCARVADLYVEKPVGNDKADTQLAFDHGMNYTTGGCDNASAIASAIRSLSTTS